MCSWRRPPPYHTGRRPGTLVPMPRGTWSPKRERQYKHILTSCLERGRGKKTCQRIATATVNKTRREHGELGSVEGDARYMRSLSDTQLRKNLCYDASSLKNAHTRLGTRVAAEALADQRDEAKRRGWGPKRIRRAENCRGRGI